MEDADEILRPAKTSVLHTRDMIFDQIASRTRQSLSELVVEWCGQSNFIDRECFHLLARELLGGSTRANEMDAIFDELDAHHTDTINFPDLYRRARHEMIFTGKLQLTLRAGNSFGNRHLAQFERNYRKKTSAHVRAHARVAVGEFDDEHHRRLEGIAMHRRMEREKLRSRSAATEGVYDKLRLPRSPSMQSYSGAHLPAFPALGHSRSQPAGAGMSRVASAATLASAPLPSVRTSSAYDGLASAKSVPALGQMSSKYGYMELPAGSLRAR